MAGDAEVIMEELSDHECINAGGKRTNVGQPKEMKILVSNLRCNILCTPGDWMYLPDLILEHIFKFLSYRVSGS